MAEPVPEGARTAPAVARNREPILEVLRPLLPDGARVLEIASGSGEHAVFMARALPRVAWRPTDRDAQALASIAAWRAAAGLPNLHAPRPLDASDPAAWPDGAVDAIVCINMIHIAPWSATQGLMAGAGERLSPGGVLFLYGPYLERDVPTAPSNLAFDASLKARDPAWGLRRLETVTDLAAGHGLERTLRAPMPANNLSLAFVRR